MSQASKYIVIYDISDNRERARTSKVLEGYGKRVQESAFECRLTTGGRERLLLSLDGLELETGFVLIYRLHDTGKRHESGKVPDDLKQTEAHAYVV